MLAQGGGNVSQRGVRVRVGGADRTEHQRGGVVGTSLAKASLHQREQCRVRTEHGRLHDLHLGMRCARQCDDRRQVEPSVERLGEQQWHYHDPRKALRHKGIHGPRHVGIGMSEVTDDSREVGAL